MWVAVNSRSFFSPARTMHPHGIVRVDKLTKTRKLPMHPCGLHPLRFVLLFFCVPAASSMGCVQTDPTMPNVVWLPLSTWPSAQQQAASGKPGHVEPQTRHAPRCVSWLVGYTPCFARGVGVGTWQWQWAGGKLL